MAQGYTDIEATQRAQTMVIPCGADGVPIEPRVFEGFQISRSALNGEADVRRAAREYLEDCAMDGIEYVEMRTGGEDRRCLEVILEGFREARAAGITTSARLISSMKRDKDPMLAQQVASNAIELKAPTEVIGVHGVVGVDFCGCDTHRFPFTSDF